MTTYRWGRWALVAVFAMGAFSVSAVCGEQEKAAPPLAQAQWIAPPTGRDMGRPLPLLRKEFSVAGKPRQATLRMVGLGDYDPRVNGVRLADTGINQPWSQYDKTLYYRDFDITAQAQAGVNCVGVMLANSFWHNPNPPPGRYNKDGPQRQADEPLLLCAEITLEQPDGTIQRVRTDATWRSADGPIVFSHIFAGEDFDARRQQPGWDRPGFDDRAWQPVRIAAAPRATLVRQDWPPFKTFERFAPVSVQEPAAGVFLYSFAQNSSAQVRIELAGGKPGDRISFRCGEHKNAHDRLFGGYVVGCELIGDGRPLGRAAPRLRPRRSGQLRRHLEERLDRAAGDLGRHDGRVAVAEPLHVGARAGMVLRLRRRHPAETGSRGLEGSRHRAPPRPADQSRSDPDDSRRPHPQPLANPGWHVPPDGRNPCRDCRHRDLALRRHPAPAPRPERTRRRITLFSRFLNIPLT